MDIKLRFSLALSAILSIFLIIFSAVVFSQVKRQSFIGVRQSLSEHIEHEFRHLSLYHDQDEPHQSTLASKEIYHRIRRDGKLIKDTFPKGATDDQNIYSHPSKTKLYQIVRRQLNNSEVEIVAYYDLSEVQRHLNTLFTVLWVGCASCLILLLPLSWLIARILLNPFRNLARVTQELDIKKLTFRFKNPIRKDEYGLLVLGINSLLDRIESSFESLKRFAVQASHELRTPLTVIRGETELGLRRKRTPEEYETILKTIGEHSERLQLMTSRLLMLADAERMEKESTVSPVLLPDSLEQIIEDLQRLHPEFHRKISIMGTACTVMFQRELLMSILTNLIENAIKYSATSVKIEYSLIGREISFGISDDGPGIQEEDIPKAFDPFSNGRNLKRIKGHGLGLSIVKACINAAHGELHFSRSKEMGGLKATAKFPLTLQQG